jgi:hypothetical protein
MMLVNKLRELSSQLLPELWTEAKPNSLLFGDRGLKVLWLLIVMLHMLHHLFADVKHYFIYGI